MEEGKMEVRGRKKKTADISISISISIGADFSPLSL